MAKRKSEDDRQGVLIEDAYEFEEEALARVLGVRVAFVRGARDGMRDGWRLERGACLYTRDGVMQVLGRCGIAAADAWLEQVMDACRTRADRASERAGWRRARIAALPVNARLAVCALMDDDERRVVRVIVGSQLGLRTGMEMSVRLVQEPDLYELVGRRPAI